MPSTLEHLPRTVALNNSLSEPNGISARERDSEATPDRRIWATKAERDATLTLFEQWEQEDANMTEEEVAQEVQFWEDFRESLNESRRACGMREL